MIAAAPADGPDLQRTVLGQYRLAVLHSQNIVGVFRQRCSQCRLAGSGKGKSLIKLQTQLFRKIRSKQRFRGGQQRLHIAGLGAKGKKIAKAGEDLHAPGGKPLCRAQGVGHRQLQHQVGAAFDGGSGPEGFVKNSRGAPLNKVAAHKANHSGIRFHRPQLLLMPQVKGVILADDSRNFQKNPSFSEKSPVQVLRYSQKYYRIDSVMAIIPQLT